ncbi:hypothetical protein [Streptomyces sp. NPDC056527]|uniref:hypothetical protein n=1 Tax=Streptomyces sp. NPDC056527 TaxID=3345853 RepID=UPI0036CC2648
MNSREAAERRLRVVPWTAKQVFAARDALPRHLRAAVDVAGGCGLRQGEVFGHSEEELDYADGWLSVGHQLKRIRGKFVFALPNGGNVRDAPSPPRWRTPSGHTRRSARP